MTRTPDNSIKKIVPFIALYLIFLLVSCETDECPYGEGNCLSNETITSSKFIEASFSDFAAKNKSKDSSVLSLRVSSKKSMKGFLEAKGTTNGFRQLLEIFGGFNNPENPISDSEYYFFDGAGDLRKTTRGNLYDPINYDQIGSNLQTQISQIVDDYNENIFYVVFSDAEMTIRQQDYKNKDKYDVIRDKVKQLSKLNPNIQIGVLTLVSAFDGSYQYDPPPTSPKNIKCNRYLYAFCFFDNKFISEFNRFAELNNENGGNNYLFNPIFDKTMIETHYDKELMHQKNRSVSEEFAAFLTQPDQDTVSICLYNKTAYNSISYNSDFFYKIGKYVQSDTMIFNSYSLIDSGKIINVLKDTCKFLLNNLIDNSIIRIEYFVESHPFPSFVNSQNSDDNVIETLNNINNPNDTLFTEGIKDVFEYIQLGLDESSKQPILINYLQFVKQ